MRRRGVCVIIPTYNNAGTVADVVLRAKAECDDVIVVNDGSDDGTAELLESIGGITVVTLARNSGKGAALRAGFMEALNKGIQRNVVSEADTKNEAAE